MPVGVHKVHPFLVAVIAGRAVKEAVGAGIGLIEKRNEVVLHGGLSISVEAELPIHGFELIACFVHMSILRQFGPSRKCKTSDFRRICLIRLHCMEGFIPEHADEKWIDSADEDAGI